MTLGKVYGWSKFQKSAFNKEEKLDGLKKQMQKKEEKKKVRRKEEEKEKNKT